MLPLHVKERTAEHKHLHFCQSLWTPAVKWCLETSIQLELGKPERTQDKPISGCQHNCSLHPARALLGLDKQSCVPAAEPSGLGSHPQQATTVPNHTGCSALWCSCSPSPVSLLSCIILLLFFMDLEVNGSSVSVAHQHPPPTLKASISCTREARCGYEK